MTILEFKMLTKVQQEEWILDYGSFVAVRQEPEFVIKLYQTNSFYVELFYHQVKRTSTSIRAFTCIDFLEPYVDGDDFCFVNYI